MKGKTPSPGETTMIHALKPLTPPPSKTEHGIAVENPAVALCQRTWERVYCSVLKKTGSRACGLFEAGEAFREALPVLDSYENIRDFIACVSFGIASHIYMEDTGKNLLNAAKVALSVHPAPPRPKAQQRADT